MRKIVALNVDETECLDRAGILDVLEECELIENAVGDPCSICEGPSGYIPSKMTSALPAGSAVGVMDRLGGSELGLVQVVPGEI